MKTVTKLSIVLMTICSLASCSKTFYSYTSRSEKIKSVELQATKTLVDINVDFKHRVTAESDWCFTEQEARNEAQYKAVTTGDADIIVDPIFRTERRTDDKKCFKVYVTGYAGFYVNPRPAIQDIQQLKDVDMENIEKHILLNHPEMLPELRKAKEENNSNVTVNNYSETTTPSVVLPTASAASSATPGAKKTKCK